jgi:exodeoxyribonuclease V gamma subunit
MTTPSIFPHANLEYLLGSLLRALKAIRVSGRGFPIAKPVPVVVPSIQFTDWLQTSIAKRTGLCMGFEFIMPQTFIERALSIAESLSEPRGNPWSKRNLVWRLLPHIPDYAARLGVKDPSPRDRLALAQLLADQFDQYAHFRPEFIGRWSGGKSAAQSNWSKAEKENEKWQRELWMRIEAEIRDGGHPSVHPALRPKVLAGNERFLKELNAAFPTLFVVGTGTLDPLLVEVLKLLASAGCEVEAHMALPSLSYLGELRKSPPESDQDPERLEMRDGHPLLVSMGRHAVGSFLLLGELDENYAHWPEAVSTVENPPSQTLLARLQSDIRKLRASEASHDQRADDVSLQVHSCFGPRREMEVLRDELLRAFRDLKDLKPDEVLIVSPSLETYAPLVTAVLEKDSLLPVRVTELPPAEQDPTAEGLLALLNMASGRGEASALLELLHLRAARACLGISDNAGGLDRLRDWIQNSGLTRGLGEREEDVPGSWRFARDRMIAGDWFGPEARAQYPARDFVLPIAEDLGSDADLRQAFIEWHWLLARNLHEWKAEATASEWSRRLGAACDTLLSSAADGDTRVEVQHALSSLAQVECGELLDAAAIFDWLQAECADSGRRTLLSGRITFGRFKQLQNLPCRVLAMVGMQDGAFPRQNRIPAWDLLHCNPRAWDRNARIDDRQLFLDAVLTPKDRLIITASTRNIRSGKIEPLSSCVDELIRVARATMRNKTGLLIEHRLQPFASGYFIGGADRLPPSFDTGNLQVAESFLKTATGIQRGTPLWNTNAPLESATPEEPLELTIEQLIYFWKDPAKAFLRAQGIAPPSEEGDDQALDRSPLRLETLGAWGVKSAAVHDVIEEGAPRLYTRALLRADRKLPQSELGDLTWQALSGRVAPLGQKIRAVRTGELAIDVEVPGFTSPVRVTGTVLQGTWNAESVWLAYRVGKFDTAKHFLEPWIQVVVVACAGHFHRACVVDDENPDQPKLRPAYDAKEAAILLRNLIEGFLQGQVRPICYGPITSDAYVDAFARTGRQWDDEPDRDALASASGKWNEAGRNRPPGEGLSASALLAWRDQDPFILDADWHKWARDIARPLRAWFKPNND